MTEPVAAEEAKLLEDALGLRAATFTLHSREPLGEGSVVGFEVPGGEGGLLYYVDTSRLRVRDETGMLLGTPEDPRARVWLHPADPHLPALAPTAFGGALAGLLLRLGISATGPAEFIVYRAGRRAVLRVPAGRGAVWVKVVRPSRLERTVHAHRAFGDAGVPGPAVLGWSPEGLIVLAEAEGVPAADVMWDADALLVQVDLLREQIADARVDVRARGIAGRVDWYATRTAALPGGEPLVRRIRERLAAAPDPGQQVVHGDLHFGQLFLGDDEAILAVIDVDTAGLGPAAEDPAAFIAHAVASALLAEGAVAARVRELADAAWRRWRAEPLVPELTSIQLLGHALSAADASAPARAQSLLRISGAVLEGTAPFCAEPAVNAEPKEPLTDSFGGS